MAAKQNKTDKPEAELKRKSVELQIAKDATKEDTATKYAKLVASPELAAYRVINSADGKGNILKDVDVPSFVNELRAQAEAANRGDFTHAEAMLMNQATALQTLFSRLTERAMLQEQMPLIEGLMRLALRSQSQCRATLETLAAIKNPPLIFAKQANIANGHQQINNGTPSPVSRAEENNNQQNELLEVQHGGATVDAGTARTAGNKDKAMATVD